MGGMQDSPPDTELFFYMGPSFESPREFKKFSRCRFDPPSRSQVQTRDQPLSGFNLASTFASLDKAILAASSAISASLLRTSKPLAATGGGDL